MYQCSISFSASTKPAHATLYQKAGSGKRPHLQAVLQWRRAVSGHSSLTKRSRHPVLERGVILTPTPSKVRHLWRSFNSESLTLQASSRSPAWNDLGQGVTAEPCLQLLGLARLQAQEAPLASSLRRYWRQRCSIGVIRWGRKASTATR